MAFRESVQAVLSGMLGEAGFPEHETISTCLLGVIDSIHTYTEEGVRLYPEIVVSANLPPLLKSLPSAQYYEIGKFTGLAEGFGKAVKRCAPLARGGWVIAINVREDEITYGVATVESAEVSLSLYSHIVGETALEEIGIPVIYLRGVGGQRVEIKTREKREIVAVTLREVTSDEREITRLATRITQDVSLEDRATLATFFAKVLGSALRETHGCLVAVVRERESSIRAFRKAFQDGAYLVEPVDFVDAVRASERLRSRPADMELRNLTILLRGMLTHDGITVFSTAGRLLAYNVFIHGKKSTAAPSGGARSRAFEALRSSKRVVCCYSLSHDGASKLWSQDA